jgi:hypothetical protein
VNDARHKVFVLLIGSAVAALLAVLYLTQGDNQTFGKAGRDAALRTSTPPK